MRWHLGVAGAVVLFASTLATWPGLGYDVARWPAVAIGTALLLAEGALLAYKRRDDLRPEGAWMWAGGALLVAHGLSFFAAVNAEAAYATLIPVAAGAAAFWAFARGWVPGRTHATMLAVTAGVALVVAVIGIGQWGSPLTGTPPGPPGVAVSTLGNPNYTGAFGAIVACVCIGGATLRTATAVRAVCLFGAVLSSVLVAVSQSRGGLVALAIGVVVAGILLSMRRDWKLLAVCVLVLAGAAVANPARIPKIFERDASAKVRIGLWKGSLKLARAHPVIGCGAGNFQYQFPPHRDAEEFTITNPSGDEVREAREPHSTWFLVFTETGPVGFAALLALVVLAGIVILRGIRLADASTAALLVASGGGLAAWSVAGVFNTLHEFAPFDILAGALLGVVAHTEARSSPTRFPNFAARGAGVLGAAFLFISSLQHAVAERRYAEAREDARALPGVLALQPGHWQTREHLAAYLRSLREHRQAVIEYERVLEVHPWNLNALNNAGVCSFLLGDTARGGRFLLRAIETQPNDWRPHYNLGVMTDDRALLLKAQELGASSDRVFLSLFEAALRANDADEAVKYLKSARAGGVQVFRTVAARHPDLVRDPRFADYLTEEK